MIVEPTLPFEFEADEEAIATEVNANFAAIFDKVKELVTLLNAAGGSAADLTARLIVSIAADGTIPELVNARNGYANLLAYLTILNGQIDDLNETTLNATLPGQAGNAGKVITTDGVNASWSFFIVWSAKSAAFAAAARNGYQCDTSAAPFTMTLPAAPSPNDIIEFQDAKGTFGGNNLTIAGNGKKVCGGDNLICDVANLSGKLVYISDAIGWRF